MKLLLRYSPFWALIVLISGGIFSGCKKDSENTENHLPVARFTVLPDRVEVNMPVTFIADSVYDKEDTYAVLEIRWDFDNNRIFETEFSTEKTNTYTYTQLGVYFPKLEVRDTKGQLDTLKKMVVVVSDLANLPPYGLNYLTPPDWQTWMEPTIDFKWTCSDPENDPLSFDIWVGKNVSTMKIVRYDITTFTMVGEEKQFETTLAGFSFNQDYYWQIAAKDVAGNYTPGPIWRFTTRPE